MSEMAQRELPEGWRLVKLGDVMHLKNGYAFKSQDYANHGTPLIRISDIKNSEISIDEAVRIPDKLLNKDFLVDSGDLLIAMSGATTGKTGVYKHSTQALQNQRVGNIKIIDEKVVNKKYRDYYIFFLRKDFEKAAYGGAQPNISAKIIESFDFPLAPLDQQKQIVAKIEELFSHIDAGVEGLKKTQRLLKQYRQSVLKAAVTGELTKEWREENRDKLEPASALLERILEEKQKKAKGKYKEPESLEDVPNTILPDTWQWVAIGQVFDVYVGATPSRKEPKYWDGDINWVSSGEVAFCRIKKTKETITGDGLKNTSTELHSPGTVMLGMIGEGKTRGQAAILDIHAAHNQNTAAIVKCVDEMSSEYLYFYLMQQYEITRRRGSGNNQKALNKTRVQAIRHYSKIPHLSPNQRIV